MVNLIINADDFAYFEGTSEGIAELINKGKISATSCMVTSSLWREHALEAKKLMTSADVGLHLCLNKFPTLTQFANFDAAKLKKISDLIWILLSGKIKLFELEHEISAQIERFQKYTGALPAFIDGHHHVQQFPLVNLALMNVLKRIDSKIYVRASVPRINSFLSLSMNLGGQIIKGLAKFNKIPVNGQFVGLYNFKHQEMDVSVFESQIRGLHSQNVIFMCHPSLPNQAQEAVDSVYQARLNEYKFLSSTYPLQIMGKYQVKLGRFEV